MATYFVFGNAPTVNELFDYTGRDESTEYPIKIEDAEDKSGHYIMNINGRMAGALINNAGIIKAIYEIDEDMEGVRLLSLLIEQWSRENSFDETNTLDIVVDDEMGIYLESNK
jgi:hypothetical protein